MKSAVFLDHLLRAAEQTGRALPDLLIEAQSLGLSHVECDLAQLDDPSIRDALRAARMDASGVYTSFDFRRKDRKADILHLLERAREAGAACVMPLPGLLREGEDRDSIRRVMADGIARVCEEAVPFGLTVVLEDFGSPRAPFGRLEELAWFLEQIPALSCAFDSGNFLIHAQDAMTAYRQLAPRVRHVHLKAWIDRPEYGEAVIPAADGYPCYPAPLGVGPVPNEPLVRALAQDGYDGFCVLEHFDARDQLACMRESAAWLRRTWPDADESREEKNA